MLAALSAQLPNCLEAFSEELEQPVLRSALQELVSKALKKGDEGARREAEKLLGLTAQGEESGDAIGPLMNTKRGEGVWWPLQDRN